MARRVDSSRKKPSVESEAALLFHETCQRVESGKLAFAAPRLGVMERRKNRGKVHASNETNGIIQDIVARHGQIHDMMDRDTHGMHDFFPKLETIDNQIIVIEGLISMLTHFERNFKPPLDLTPLRDDFKTQSDRLIDQRIELVNEFAGDHTDKYKFSEHGEERRKSGFDYSDDEASDHGREAGGEGGEGGSTSPLPGASDGGGGGGGSSEPLLPGSRGGSEFGEIAEYVRDTNSRLSKKKAT